MADLNTTCEECGVAKTLSQFAPKCHGNFRLPGATKPPRVFVALGKIAQDEFPQPTAEGGAPTWVMPRLDFFVQALVGLGWAAQDIRDTFEFGHTFRCPLPPKTEPKAAQKKLCGRWTLFGHAHNKYELIVFWGHDLWMYLDKNRLAGDTLHRIVPATFKLEITNDAHHAVAPDSGMMPANVLTIWDPNSVRRAPDEYDIEMWTASLKWIRLHLDGYRHDPFRDSNYMICRDADNAIAVLKWFESQEYVGLDIETGNAPHALDVFSNKFKVLTLQLSASRGVAYVIPLFHKDLPLGNDPRVIDAVRSLSKSKVKFVAHNGVSFDLPGLNRTIGTEFDLFADTMLMDGMINENRQHKLKEIILIHEPSMAFYDDELEAAFVDAEGERDYELHVPFDTLCRYGAADPDATLRMFFVMAKRLYEMPSTAFPTMWDFFINHVMRDAKAAQAMTANGMVIDLERRDELSSSLKTALDAAKARVLSDPRCERFAMYRAAEYVQSGCYFSDTAYIYHAFHTARHGLQPIYNITTRAELELGAREKLIRAAVLKKNGEPYTNKLFTERDVRFRITAPADTVYMVTTVLTLPIVKETKGGKTSVDAEVLKEFAKTDSWFTSLLEYRALEKRYGTYAKPVVQGLYEDYSEDKDKTEIKQGWLRDDGLVHGEFMLTGREYGDDSDDSLGGTRTGRKSARRPNTTNFIKHKEGGAEVYKLFTSRYADKRFPFALDEEHAQALWEAMPPQRKLFVERFVFPGQPGGGAILAADYSQLELRIFAIVVHSMWMLGEFAKKGVDLHAQLAMSVFSATLKEVMANNKYLRFLAKKLWFGPIYMQGVRSLWAELMKSGAKSIHNPNELITIEETQEMLDGLYRKLPEFDGYKTAVEDQLHKSMTVYSVCGRRRFLPQIFSTDKYIANKAVRQGVNFGVQSPGADCMNWSAYTIHEAYQRLRHIQRRPLLVNTVHDCAVQDAPSELVPEMWFTTQNIMQNVPWPELNRKQSPIILQADGDVGPDWGSTAEIKEKHEAAWKDMMMKNGGSLCGLFTIST